MRHSFLKTSATLHPSHANRRGPLPFTRPWAATVFKNECHILSSFLSVFLLFFITSCKSVSFTDSKDYPPIVPDCIGVTVPEGLPQLVFEMADGRPFKVETSRVADTVFYSVRAWDRKTGRGVRYAAFPVYVSADPIDPYVAYRLIEPSYEGWKEMGLYYRELASYKEKAIIVNKSLAGGCVNCHNFQGGDPSNLIFHARGAGGGTVFAKDGNARIINLTTVGPHKQGVYPAWHPGGRYVAFSSNSTQQCFPVAGSQQIEVYDNRSDIILMDLQTDSVYAWQPLCEDTRMETFPAWDAGGNTLYYCVADSVSNVVESRGRIHYALGAVDFADGTFVGEPRTVWQSDSLSVSFPRINGKWLLFTGAAYATFPIWHREADLYLMDLQNGTVVPASELNSPDTESYHSWSSNGKWVVFSSRRLDGRYTRLFIAHFDGEGNFGKPFLLPQKSYEHNVLRLKSYNVPEFVCGQPLNYDRQVSKLFAE